MGGQCHGREVGERVGGGGDEGGWLEKNPASNYNQGQGHQLWWELLGNRKISAEEEKGGKGLS